MKNIQGFFDHIVVRSMLFAIFGMLGLVGIYGYAQTHGGLKWGDTSGITYLTEGNAENLLHIKMGADGKFSSLPTAGASEAILVVECPTEACEDSGLNLAGVTADFQGKVIVLALDPYKQSTLDQELFADFVKTPVLVPIVKSVVESYLQANNLPETEDSIEAALNQPQVNAVIQQAILHTGGLQSLYPKFLLFTPQGMTLIGAKAGLDDKDAIESWVNGGLAQLDNTPFAGQNP